MKIRVSKKIGIVFFALGVSGWVLAQGGSNQDNFAKMVDFLPPPPNAAAIIKYGGINVNKNTGAPSVNIPLLTLKSKKISTSVALSYSATGIKVDEIASRVGMGWALQAGGVVTRTVRGTPDEVNPRKVPWAAIGENWATYNYMNMIAQSDNWSGYDSEPDLFNFNINGFSGAFVMDGSMNIVQVNQSNIKIYKDFTSSAPWNFKITTPDGVIHYFGGAGATEKTRRDQICTKVFDTYLPTSWYIKSIVHPNGDSIAFNYTAHNYSYDNGVSQVMHWTTAGPPSGGTAGSCGSAQCSTNPMTTCVNLTLTQGVLLDEIVVPGNAKIKFYYTTRSDCSDKLVSRVELINSVSSTVINAFDFTYTTVTAAGGFTNQTATGHTYTPYLTALTEKSGDNTLSKPYYFTYHEPGSRAPRLSFSQDHWGYFNGKQNLYFIPKPDDPQLQNMFTLATANREPDYNYAVKGMLTKIIYPTGGIDSIMYESNTFYEAENISPHHLYCESTGTGFSTEVVKSIPLPVGPNQAVNLFINCIDNSGTGQYDPLHNKGTVEILNSNNQVVFSKWLYPGTTAQEYPFLASGYYTVKIKAKGSVNTTRIVLKYYSSISTQSASKPVGGLRTKAILTSVPENKPILKEYYYGEMESPGISSLYNVKRPVYVKSYNKWMWCVINLPGTAEFIPNYLNCPSTSMHSNSLISLFDYQGSPVSYASVIESTGENFAGGATQSKFYVGSDSRGWVLWGDDILEAPLNNTSSFLNGKLKEEIIYKKNSSGSLVALKKQKFVYKVNNIQSVYGYVVNRSKDPDFVPGDTSMTNINNYWCKQPPNSACGYHNQINLQELLKLFSMFKYEVASSWVRLDTLTETLYDENGLNPVITVTKNFYENASYPDLLTKTETYNSKGELLKTENKYPHHFAGTAVYDDMVSKNIISPLVEATTFNGTTQLGKIKTNYYNWGNGNYEPVTVESSIKTGALEVEGTINQRDIYGNILEYTGKDGVVNSIIWGYGYLYPVAKVTGAAYSQAIAQLSVPVATLQNMDGFALQTELHRIRTGLTSAYVTTYTYKHLVGVLTITDPNNKTNTYEYDAFHRLKIVKDQDGNVVKKIDYTYTTPDPNATFTIYFNTQTFQFINCGNCFNGYMPTSVNYIVPAKKHFSLISQAEADAKAAADIATNGQKYANRNGWCSTLDADAACAGEGKKRIGCLCETGIKLYIAETYIGNGLWQCTYRYTWSDGSWSQNYTEIHTGPCID